MSSKQSSIWDWTQLQVKERAESRPRAKTRSIRGLSDSKATSSSQTKGALKNKKMNSKAPYTSLNRSGQTQERLSPIQSTSYALRDSLMDYAQRPGIPGNRRNFDARTGFEQPSQSAPTKPDPENVPPSQLDFDDPGIPAQAQKDDQVQLSEEQQNVLEAVKQGKNVFFTGPAGTGKSVVLRAIVKWARTTYTQKEIGITSTTGIASKLIGGRTIHSWAGIQPGNEDLAVQLNRIQQSATTVTRWKTARIIVIDEVSMLDGRLFDVLNQIAQALRESHQPFGGIQLVLTGDFYQLPPVRENSYRNEFSPAYAFHSITWRLCIQRPMFLNQVFRQTDNCFVDILAAMRRGVVSDEHERILQGLNRTITYTDGIEATQLYPITRQSDKFNELKLRNLPSIHVRHIALDTAGHKSNGWPISLQEAETLLDGRLVVSRELNLKIGAQVMLIQNTGRGEFVNGDVGKVTEYLTIRQALARTIPIAGIDGEKLRFQGDIDTILCEIAKYLNFAGADVDWHTAPDLLTFSVTEKWPLVDFADGRMILCPPQPFTIRGRHGFVEAQRRQVPLILAWAISIHKSQGQTLARVSIDLEHAFENGQVYVALSRATSLDTLEVRNFKRARVLCSPVVRIWEAEMLKVEEAEADFDSPMASQLH